jgi:hypothetical protein
VSYLNQSEIADNPSMLARVAQCAAQQGEKDPDGWTQTNRRFWAAAPGWDAAWASAQASHPDPEPPTPLDFTPYDPGADEAVITDEMILSQVQAMRP